MGNELRETAYSNSPTWVQWPWRRKECCRSIRPLAEGLQLSAHCRWIIHSWVKYSFRWNWENYNKLTGLYSTPTTWRNCVIVRKMTFRKSNRLSRFVIHNAGSKQLSPSTNSSRKLCHNLVQSSALWNSVNNWLDSEGIQNKPLLTWGVPGRVHESPRAVPRGDLGSPPPPFPVRGATVKANPDDFCNLQLSELNLFDLSSNK